MLIKINRKQKDNKKRSKFLGTEVRRRFYKFMMNISIKERDNQNYLKYYKLLSELPIVQINNYCYITGRSRGVYRKFRMSRHQIREKFKYLNGLMNSSW